MRTTPIILDLRQDPQDQQPIGFPLEEEVNSEVGAVVGEEDVVEAVPGLKVPGLK